MTTATRGRSDPAVPDDPLVRFVRAGLVCGAIDGIPIVGSIRMGS